MPHRNSQKRIYEEGGEYFVTCKTRDNSPFFKEEIFCRLWIEELKLCKKLKGFQLFGFCLLPDHFHMVVKPRGKEDVSKVMHSLKRNFSRDANRVLFGFNEDIQKPVGAISKSRQIDGEDVDLRLREQSKNFHQKYGKRHPFSKFSWQKSFYDHLIRSDRDFENCLSYTVENFLKHELSPSWRYTSLNYPNLIDVY
ncbi:MAG: transposase [Candidatus Peribacteraceae bacterium]|nr:transposase [Candidatus Peribacteraceae bacterium]